MVKFKCRIDSVNLVRLQDALQGIKDGGAGMLADVVNKTLTGVRSDIIDQVQTILTADRDAIQQAISVEEASPQQLSGSLVVTGKSLPLSAFSHRQTDSGVEVMVKVGRAPAVVRGSFLTTMRSGGTGIFRRLWRGDAAKPKKNIGYGRLPAYFRLPVKKLYSTGVGDIVFDEPLASTVMEKAADRLLENLDSELNSKLDRI